MTNLGVGFRSERASQVSGNTGVPVSDLMQFGKGPARNLAVFVDERDPGLGPREDEGPAARLDAAGTEAEGADGLDAEPAHEGEPTTDPSSEQPIDDHAL